MTVGRGKVSFLEEYGHTFKSILAVQIGLNRFFEEREDTMMGREGAGRIRDKMEGDI